MTVPAGVEAVANGILESRRHERLDDLDVGREGADGLLSRHRHDGPVRPARLQGDGIRYWDAVDPDLYAPTGRPRTGEQFAISQQSEPAYKRLARTIAVPAGGATLSFWINRDTEQNWDFVFVEAHTVGLQDWKTLRT